MDQQAAVVLGASGLTGSLLLQQILREDNFNTVRVLVRKELPVQHPRLQQVIVDFNNLHDLRNKFGTGEVIFCCIGTTQKKVKGDKIAYEKIDHDIAVNAAEIGVANGFTKFLLVSSAGADPGSSNFYLSLKGRIETDVQRFPLNSISIFRPSMLLGNRQERRPAEKIMQGLMQTLSFLFAGPLKKYHPISAEDVAKAMLAASKLTGAGVHILEYKEMISLIKQDRHLQQEQRS